MFYQLKRKIVEVLFDNIVIALQINVLCLARNLIPTVNGGFIGDTLSVYSRSGCYIILINSRAVKAMLGD
jgi:hypothetical protein